MVEEEEATAEDAEAKLEADAVDADAARTTDVDDGIMRSTWIQCV